MNKLKPCPFCGSSDVDPNGWLNENQDTGPQCMGCGATAGNRFAWDQRAVPEGFALVPVEPTSAIISAGKIEVYRSSGIDDIKNIYKAMIEAAQDEPETTD